LGLEKGQRGVERIGLKGRKSQNNTSRGNAIHRNAASGSRAIEWSSADADLQRTKNGHRIQEFVVGKEGEVQEGQGKKRRGKDDCEAPTALHAFISPQKTPVGRSAGRRLKNVNSPVKPKKRKQLRWVKYEKRGSRKSR